MCLGGGSSNKAAKQARADEAAREAKIKAGQLAIGRVFGGGKVVSDPAVSYDPSQRYYLESGELFNPAATAASKGEISEAYRSMYPGKLKPTNQWAGDMQPDPAALEEFARLYPGQKLASEGKLFRTVATAPGFNDQFYAQRGKAYRNVALPQVTAQTEQARKNLVYQLARSGGMRSSAAIDADRQLQATAAGARRTVADEALNQENQLRSEVERTRSDLVNQLLASADPDMAVTSATAAAQRLERPSGFAPIGNLFEGLTNMWAQNAMARTYDPTVPKMFSPGRGKKDSSRIVRG